MLAVDNNLYRLHEELFPSSHAPPAYGDIIFDVHTPCDPNDPNAVWVFTDLPCNEHYELVYTHWSSSLLLAHVDPVILGSFQLHLLNLILHTSGTTELSIVEDRDDFGVFRPDRVILRLTLIVNVTDLELPWGIVEPVILDMTSWVRYHVCCFLTCS